MLKFDTDPTFLEGHAATVNVRLDGEHKRVGMFGIMHPSVLKNYELLP